MSGAAARMRRERSAVRQPAEPATTFSPTEDEIATVAYQLWLDNGCLGGTDREDWFRAEALLKNPRATQRGDLSMGPSISARNTRPEPEFLAEICWEGHWEVWEMEYGGAHWVPNSPL